MKKTLILVTALAISIFSAGCSNTSTEDSSSGSSSTNSTSTSSSDISISSGSTTSSSTSSYTPFILNDNSIYPTSFLMYESSLVYANWEDNNKISIFNDFSSKTSLKTSEVTDFFNYSSYTMTLVNNYIYFGDAGSSNNLASINLNDKTYTKLNDRNIHSITSYENKLFYVDYANGDSHESKLYSYDLNTNTDLLLCSYNIGKYILNGDFIIYQNLSDSSKLYRMNTDGSNNQKITDFSVESFAPYSSELLVINSDDNNSLYVVDPSTLTPTRLNLLNGTNLKVYNNKLYYVSSTNYLCTLNVDLTSSEVSSNALTDYSINEYYPSDNYIFIEKGSNITTPYVIPIS